MSDQASVFVEGRVGVLFGACCVCLHGCRDVLICLFGLFWRIAMFICNIDADNNITGHPPTAVDVDAGGVPFDAPPAKSAVARSA